MGNIGVYLTDSKKIFVVSCASTLPTLLDEDEVITEKWFYNRPFELERFFKEYPEEEDLFNQAFAYWVICKIFRLDQSETAYGILKRELKKFSSNLLSKVRRLIKAAVNDIRSFWLKKKRKVEKFSKKNNMPLPKKKSYRKKIYD